MQKYKKAILLKYIRRTHVVLLLIRRSFYAKIHKIAYTFNLSIVIFIPKIIFQPDLPQLSADSAIISRSSSCRDTWQSMWRYLAKDVEILGKVCGHTGNGV